MTAAEPEIIAFADGPAFEAWLAANCDRPEGIWLRIYKKASSVVTVTYDEALRAALCYGWIDGQKKGLDEVSFLQKFTPRRPRSLWSKRNCELVGQLTAEGRMRAPGQREIDAAKADGRWDAAYDKPSEMQVPADFLTALAAFPEAEAFFRTLNKANTYAIAWRLQTAKKPETRRKRFDQLIDMLRRCEKLH